MSASKSSGRGSLRSTNDLPEINVNTFYSSSLPYLQARSKSNSSINNSQKVKSLPQRLNNLFGPTQTWKVFHRQHDALEFSKNKRSGLMTFSFQQSDGKRLFLVAHPKVFWHYDTKKYPSERCTYEIIPETSVCKLYFDLEFDVEFNPDKCGSSLVKMFIDVVAYFLRTCFGLVVTKDQILDLDSSTNKKFSRHLIFQSKCFVFQDNKNVGLFVQFVSRKIELYIRSEELNLPQQSDEKDKNTNTMHRECLCCQMHPNDCVRDIGIPVEDIKQFYVLDRKGNKVMFCDQSVYSKNRHFRIFQNTKWGKNTPLLLSPDNSYKPNLHSGFKSEDVYLETLFLDSLISYFELSSDKSTPNVKVINFSPMESSVSTKTREGGVEGIASTSCSKESTNKRVVNNSPYPDVDNFINKLVSPGRIWRSVYFASSSAIVYDIVGNRYCENIRRQHKSNNVKYIVNLSSYTYYQKCHDFECLHFRSTASKLPVELVFKLDGDCCTSGAVEEADSSVSESDLVEVASVVEDLSFHMEEFESDV